MRVLLTGSDLGFRPVPGTGGNRFYPPEGWKGKTQPREYKGTDVGEGTVSRRQVRNIMANSAGYTSQAQYEYRNSNLLRTDPAYRNFVRMYREERGGWPGPQSQVMSKYMKARDLLNGNRKSKAYRDPKGPVADFLEYIGVRKPHHQQYQVGESG